MPLEPAKTTGDHEPRAVPNHRSSTGPPLRASNTFSIFWITDTQFLSESNPALFRMMTNWIVQNWETYNGKLVIHTGDLVQDGYEETEWQAADEAMTILLEHGIPYTWCAGNHDDATDGDPTYGWHGSTWAGSLAPWNVRSKVDALPGMNWVDDYRGGMNTAVSFVACGVKFLVLSIEWNAPPDVLQWAESILGDPLYANCHVIMAPHAYMDYNGSLDDTQWGPTLAAFVSGLTELMDRHSSNIFLTLNGHFPSECGFNTTRPINNRNQLMFDRQDCFDAPGDPNGRGVDLVDGDTTAPDSDKVGGATLMVLTFDMSSNQIIANTYDVYTGEWRTGPNEQYTVSMFSTPTPDNS